MLIKKKDDYTLIIISEKSSQKINSSFLEKLYKFKEEHLFLHISKKFNNFKKIFSLFLELATQKKENGTSFVIINNDIQIDELPDNLNVTPTLKEAEDILEMENIERELGF